MSNIAAAPSGLLATAGLKAPAGLMLTVGIAAAIACVAIAALTWLLPFDGKAAVFLLDHGTGSLFTDVYPATIQNLLHVLLAVGLGILVHRWRRARFEYRFLEADLLPTDDFTLLSLADLGKLRRQVLPFVATGAALPVLVDTAILQALNTRSPEQAGAAINIKLELLSHRLDLEYQTSRYIAWLIPTIGFIGTIVGIAFALDGINPTHLDMRRITSGLGVAFYTTIVALIESAILVFVQNTVQRREELALNAAADHCLTNLVNRIHVAD
jgi:biopolymer transport protein ExbB/TolQ